MGRIRKTLLASLIFVSIVLLSQGTGFNNGSGGACGTGATNLLVKWTSASACGSSSVTDTGSGVGVFASPSGLLTVFNTAGTQARMNVATNGDLVLADAASPIITLSPSNNSAMFGYWTGSGTALQMGRKGQYDVFTVNTHFDSPGASELINAQVLALTHTIQGNLALQRSFNIGQMTYSAAGAQTVTTGASFGIDGPPIQGANVTLTTPLSMRIAAGQSQMPGFASNGTKFTISGCSAGTTVGGSTAGQFASGTTGTCTVVITLGGLVAPNGWACSGSNISTGVAIPQSATSTTTCTISGTTTSGNTIVFQSIGY